jgi:lipopolysaccharide transport system ATP-binding protein
MSAAGADTVIRVENVHKRYRLGVVGSSLVSDEIRALWAIWRGRPDPRISLESAEQQQRIGPYFWSLRGVSFDVQRGESLGIIGRNGAGKSTMLKLLSRITLPTEGRISMRGKVSSLLEVGTGFHTELTGMENIYLNGAILGMRRWEIDRKLDDIIAFSGIEHHIDTPLKRYSSGMKVRLGFAVAAHLDPDIMIVDEVLAVGDAEFQARCLGSMRDAGRSGRTVLFVSHDMGSVEGLCQRVIWMDKGRVLRDGPTLEVVQAYARDGAAKERAFVWEPAHAPGNDAVRVRSLAADHALDDGCFGRSSPITITAELDILKELDLALDIQVQVFTDSNVLAFMSVMGEVLGPTRWGLGRERIRCTIPAGLLNTGGYRVALTLVRNGQPWIPVPEVLRLEVRDTLAQGEWAGRWQGIVRPQITWVR